ncbi:MAG: hypothetical protein DMG60_20165 [Acidobacteria bacterium]|nr:MAG: hypothetical protein DMG60_20165 [Acidobacteriota bacterium]
MNPHWRDLIAEWEDKYGLEFRLDGRITAKLNQSQAKSKTKDPSTPVSRAGENAREPSSAQDG